jgi:sialic acid synthase SpsE
MERPKVVAEIGQGKGSVDYVAQALVAARDTGCWAGKVQLLQPETIVQPHAAVYWDERRPDIVDQGASFATVGCLDYEATTELLDIAAAVGIQLVATPFDLEAVDVMARSGMRWCKIASGDITNQPLVQAAGNAFPHGVILSTGAATSEEISEAIDWIGTPWAVLACTLAYPTADADAELRRIPTLGRLVAERSPGTLVGYSDHTHGSATAGFAVAAGATVLEKHFTLDRADRSVPDNSFAVDPGAMTTYVEAADAAAQMLGTGELGPIPAELPARTGARRTICAVRDLPAGHRINAEDLVMLRPAVDSSFAPADLHRVAGATTVRAIGAGSAIERSAVILAT